VAKPRRTSKGVVAQKAPRSSDVAEAIFAIVAAAPDALSVSQIAAKAKREPTSVGSALNRLKAAGRVFNAGRAIHGRWAVSQEIANEAVAALRGEA
jgi:DNA-binding IclR family transcriptional regulator